MNRIIESTGLINDRTGNSIAVTPSLFGLTGGIIGI
jgi:hypothetical protein